MSKNQEKILEDKLFQELHTNNQEENKKISQICSKIASSVINLYNSPSLLNLRSYQTTVMLSEPNISNFDQKLGKILKVVKDYFPREKNKEIRENIDSVLIEKAATDRIIESDIRLSNLNKIKSKEFTEIQSMLRDKMVGQQREFTEKEAKKSGLSKGYIAKEKETDHTFILKQFYKRHKDCLAIKDPEKRKQAIQNRMDNVQELLGSTMYESLLLYYRAPKEELVQPDKNHQNSLYIRSKFFDNAKSLAEFTGNLPGATHINASNTQLKQLIGFEKVIAACNMLGDGDYHAANLMVQNGSTLTKIDHGKSFMIFYSDFSDMIEFTHTIFSQPGVNYEQAIEKGNLSFNIDKYSQALNQMINQLDGKQIDNIIDQKMDELQKNEFDPKGMIIQNLQSGRDNTINNFDDLRKIYKENIQEHLANMKEIAKDIDIITKFDNVSDKFKQGGWLKEFAELAVDPITYAKWKNITIDKQKPLDWAKENNYTIQVDSEIKTTTVKKQEWQKQGDNWQETEVLVKEKQKNIKSCSPSRMDASSRSNCST